MYNIPIETNDADSVMKALTYWHRQLACTLCAAHAGRRLVIFNYTIVVHVAIFLVSITWNISHIVCHIRGQWTRIEWRDFQFFEIQSMRPELGILTWSFHDGDTASCINLIFQCVEPESIILYASFYILPQIEQLKWNGKWISSPGPIALSPISIFRNVIAGFRIPSLPRYNVGYQSVVIWYIDCKTFLSSCQ